MTIHPVKRIPFTENEFPEKDDRPVVLFASIESDVYSTSYMIDGFQKVGYRVECIHWQRVKFNEGVGMLQSLLVAKAMKEEVDLIFLHIQSEGILNTAIVSSLQDIAPTVIYNFDCRAEEKMQWLYQLVPYAEMVCFSNLDDVHNCAKLGYSNTCVLKSSADYDHYCKLPNVTELKKEYPHEIVFIGNRFDNTNMDFPLAKERTEMVGFLRGIYGDRFKAWGIGFSRMVNQQEERNIYNCAKIAITHNNFYRTNYCSDRTFRAMGCGVFTIQKHYPLINQDFSALDTAVWFNLDGLKTEIDKHLFKPQLRVEKAFNGYEHVRLKHSWFNRVIELNELMANNRTKKMKAK